MEWTRPYSEAPKADLSKIPQRSSPSMKITLSSPDSSPQRVPGTLVLAFKLRPSALEGVMFFMIVEIYEALDVPKHRRVFTHTICFPVHSTRGFTIAGG